MFSCWKTKITSIIFEDALTLIHAWLISACIHYSIKYIQELYYYDQYSKIFFVKFAIMTFLLNINKCTHITHVQCTIAHEVSISIHCMTCIVVAIQGVELGQIHVSIKTFIYHMLSQARNKAHTEQYSCIQMDEIINIATHDNDIQILILLDAFNQGIAIV